MKMTSRALIALTLPALLPAQTSILDSAPFSWGPNIGWIDWRGNLTSGAVLNNPPVASGFIYSANIGWIHLGDGTPTDGIAYGNNTADDYGVNLDTTNPGIILLSGYAYSANAGWISFEGTDPATRPRIDKATGRLAGYAYGANIGWLPLDAAEFGVSTDVPPLGFEGFALY